MKKTNKNKAKKAWKDYPIGTKANAVMGGYWEKTNKGWKWCTGDTFPTPGADVISIELPIGKKKKVLVNSICVLKRLN